LSIRLALLDDQVGRVPLDHALDLGKLVAWKDRETSRFSANRLVLGHRHRDRFGAVSASALTDELDRFALGLDFDEVRRDLGHALVYLAEQRLVPSESFLSCPHENHFPTTRPGSQGFDVHEVGKLLFQATWGSHVRAEEVFREANESVAAKAGELKFAHPLPFLCECRDRHCFARISLTLEEYEQVRSDPRRYLTIPGHETGAA
jgi:hypothetical protein